MVVDALGLIQLQNGGAMTVASSAHVNLFGQLNVENTGSIVVAADAGSWSADPAATRGRSFSRTSRSCSR